MRNILLKISYDGTDFCGWQTQNFADKGKPCRTVQQTVETALERLHKTKISIQGSGRTDSGVHAFAQAANFFSPVDSIPIENYPRALNCLLPDDVRIMDASVVSDDFSSRYSATSRIYRYFISTKTPSATSMRYVWNISHKPDIKVLNEMAQVLRGEMNCSTFASAGDQSVSMNRFIDDAHFFYEGETLVFQIEANAFLWKMVRSITGSLIHFERLGKDASFFREVVQSHDRKKAGPTAPAKGLFLYEVKFDGLRRHV
ncbi:tRNA pseudouridine(38-40) synthase TruA [Treponema pectinovorum]|uniref:tRNA pseudouridine(38-40) synthase TruA n=1 Tax=Treponema pectinovorum TaxID=164 RepID=UPI0011C9A97F|nr:tRNA pseudouridine(38-40) synthase TruA [Treponema pectinovorum]